jgi:hypothetical protein
VFEYRESAAQASRLDISFETPPFVAFFGSLSEGGRAVSEVLLK